MIGLSNLSDLISKKYKAVGIIYLICFTVFQVTSVLLTITGKEGSTKLFLALVALSIIVFLIYYFYLMARELRVSEIKEQDLKSEIERLQSDKNSLTEGINKLVNAEAAIRGIFSASGKYSREEVTKILRDGGIKGITEAEVLSIIGSLTESGFIGKADYPEGKYVGIYKSHNPKNP